MLSYHTDSQHHRGATLDRVELTPQLKLAMKKVLRAAARCQAPTTTTIASLAGVSEELCLNVLNIAQSLGFIEYDVCQDEQSHCLINTSARRRGYVVRISPPLNPQGFSDGRATRRTN